MATVSLVLPTHCHVKRRDNYQDVYFIIHKDVRPEGWPATIFVGRIGRESPHDIITKGNQINVDYENFAANRSGQQRIDQLLGTFPHIVRLYKESPFFLDLGMQSRETYTYSLERILEWSEENDHPHIKFFTVAVASKFLQKFDHAPFAQRSYKKVLSRLCTIAVQEGFLQGNPMRDVVLRRKPKSGRQIRLWTDEKMLQFAKEADGLGFPSMADILYVGCDLSQRLSDILPMEQHVDYVDGVFYFLQNKTGVQVYTFAVTARSHEDAIAQYKEVIAAPFTIGPSALKRIGKYKTQTQVCFCGALYQARPWKVAHGQSMSCSVTCSNRLMAINKKVKPDE